MAGYTLSEALRARARGAARAARAHTIPPFALRLWSTPSLDKFNSIPSSSSFLLAHFIELRDREEKMLFAELAAAPLQ